MKRFADIRNLCMHVDLMDSPGINLHLINLCCFCFPYYTPYKEPAYVKC